jgi:hypothetical protein
MESKPAHACGHASLAAQPAITLISDGPASTLQVIAVINQAGCLEYNIITCSTMQSWIDGLREYTS